MELEVALETVCRLILRAREYEAVPGDAEPDERTGEAADDEVGDDDENPAEIEIRALVDDLADDEQAELIALAMVGNGSFDAAEWPDALDAAAEEIFDAADWLLAQPALSSDLEAGLAAFELDCGGLGTVV